MKRLIPATLLTSAALLAATTLPASASTVSIPVPGATSLVAVDTSTKLVYVGTTPAAPPDRPDVNSSAGVSVVDPSTRKVVKAVALDYLQSYGMGEGVADVAVSAQSRDLWVLVGWGDTAGGCWSKLYQLNKTSMATIRTYSLGCSSKVEVDPTSEWAYLTEAPQYADQGGASAPPVTKGSVVAVNGATGAVTRAVLPSPAVPSAGDHYDPTSIAFDRYNYGIYVVGQNHVWVYTTKLQLVHTTTLGYSTFSGLSAAANRVTNRIYVTDGRVVSEISGPTGNVTRTSVLGGGSTMEIDTGSNVLYLGTNTISLSTLTSTGKQTYKVAAVDSTTHARYWAAPSQLYVTR